MRGGDDEFVVLTGQLDHAFLQRGHHGIAHLNCEITARDHDAVAGQQNFQQLGDCFCTLNLGDQTGLVVVFGSGHIAQLARHFHIGRVFGKAHRHIVRLEAHRGTNVIHVFGGQRGRSQSTALFVDALVVG